MGILKSKRKAYKEAKELNKKYSTEYNQDGSFSVHIKNDPDKEKQRSDSFISKDAGLLERLKPGAKRRTHYFEGLLAQAEREAIQEKHKENINAISDDYLKQFHKDEDKNKQPSNKVTNTTAKNSILPTVTTNVKEDKLDGISPMDFITNESKHKGTYKVGSDGRIHETSKQFTLGKDYTQPKYSYKPITELGTKLGNVFNVDTFADKNIPGYASMFTPGIVKSGMAMYSGTSLEPTYEEMLAAQESKAEYLSKNGKLYNVSNSVSAYSKDGKSWLDRPVLQQERIYNLDIENKHKIPNITDIFSNFNYKHFGQTVPTGDEFKTAYELGKEYLVKDFTIYHVGENLDAIDRLADNWEPLPDMDYGAERGKPNAETESMLGSIPYYLGSGTGDFTESPASPLGMIVNGKLGKLAKVLTFMDFANSGNDYNRSRQRYSKRIQPTY